MKSLGSVFGHDDPEANKERHEASLRSRAAYWKAIMADGYVPPVPTNTLGQEEFAVDGGRPCRNCHGTRLVKMPDGHIRRCSGCNGIRDESELEGMRQAAGLGVSQWHKSFATFEARKGTERARTWCEQWAAKLEPVFLHVCGEPGCGKTHLALACARALIEQGQSVVFMYGGDLMDEWFRHKSAGDLDDWWGVLRSTTPLILDDIGTVRASGDFDFAKLETLIDYRYRHGYPTLVTSIGTTEDMKQRLSRSIGRRLEDTSMCRSIRIEAQQYRGSNPDLPF
jgi:DNA replication protein DnaC